MQNTIYARQLRKNQTDAEKLLWLHLRNRQFLDIKFCRQKPINGYIVDFVSPDKKLIIELDGGQHNDEQVKESDEYRTEVLLQGGYTILRFWNSEVLRDLEGVLERIQHFL